ncbi:putative pentatricopeptide repeat-containing protein At3g13770, mitochondrial [Papaver somniferum]|uniref:putative pentatricopeptide repeat-containing protein At3g13770, mitochondrial n=1 Tax=Papaver somniferum TaxID=3469 RepID=UPI000E703E50|nr:putative pentatricopeptide repeat-containing protein At3g13770, mitochondrial [Papaver somniferum]
MTYRDVVLFNTVISTSFRTNGKLGEGVKLFSKMKREDLEPNHITLSALIGACAGCSASVNLTEIFHGQAIRCRFLSNCFVGSSLVDNYGKQMKLKEAVHAFDDIVELDLLSCNITIDCFARNGCKEKAMKIFSRLRSKGVEFDSFTLNKEAVKFYERMLKVGMKENQFTFASILPAYSSLTRLEQGMQLHGRIIKSGFVSDTLVCNALIDMYFKCGSLIE